MYKLVLTDNLRFVGVVLPRGVRYVGEFVKVEPLIGVFAVDIITPVADSILLVEGGVVGTHVGDASTVLVTHVEELTVELLVGVEAHRSVRAVEGERDVGELLPSLLPV